MTTLKHHPSLDVMVERDVVTHRSARQALAALRIVFGLTFLWAFFDKMFALGYHTGVDPVTGELDRYGDAAWINGGSPTNGFLSNVSEDNWLHGFWTSFAGATWADWLFMAGLLGVGLTLTFGVGIRLGAIAGAALYVMMWMASFPLENNPVLDDHVVGFVALTVLALTLAGDTWGLGTTWAKTHLVRKYPILR